MSDIRFPLHGRAVKVSLRGTANDYPQGMIAERFLWERRPRRDCAPQEVPLGCSSQNPPRGLPSGVAAIGRSHNSQSLRYGDQALPGMSNGCGVSS